MPRYTLLMTGLAVLGLTVSCQHLDVAGTSSEPAVQSEVAGGAPAPVSEAEAARQAQTADLLDKAAALPIDKELSSRRALTEVEERLVLPENYGRTVVITGDNEPLALPKGPMEELVNRKVTMQLHNADVVALAEALSQIDGLNIIRDDTLTATKTATILVKDVPLVEVLNYAARNMGIAFHVGDSVIWVTQAEDQATGPALETRIYKIRHGLVPAGAGAASGSVGGSGGDNAESVIGGGSSIGQAGAEDTELDDALKLVLTDPAPGAAYEIYRNRNLLVVRDSREKLRLVEQIVRELDRTPQQVLIEARFVTMSHRDYLELGTDVKQLLIDAGPKLQVDATSLFPTAEASDVLGGKLGVSGIVGNTTYNVILRALQELDNAQTLSAPRVTVLNNHSATINDGSKSYYYKSFSTQSINNSNGTTQMTLVPDGEATEITYGLLLGVTVSIGNDGQTVMLALSPTVRTPLGDGFESYPVGTTGSVRLPKFAETSLSTTAAVNSGQTVILGGTMTSTESKGESKTPLLGDLPLLGFLFRHTTNEVSPKHLLIFVTATIIAPSGEFVQTVAATPAGGAN